MGNKLNRCFVHGGASYMRNLVAVIIAAFTGKVIAQTISELPTNQLWFVAIVLGLSSLIGSALWVLIAIDSHDGKYIIVHDNDRIEFKKVAIRLAVITNFLAGLIIIFIMYAIRPEINLIYVAATVMTSAAIDPIGIIRNAKEYLAPNKGRGGNDN